jgi:hypothetical protein
LKKLKFILRFFISGLTFLTRKADFRYKETQVQVFESEGYKENSQFGYKKKHADISCCQQYIATATFQSRRK